MNKFVKSIIIILLLAVIGITVYFLVQSPKMQEIWNDTLAPIIATVIASVSTLYIALLPILSKVKNGAVSFLTASATNKKVLDENTKLQENIVQLESKINNLEMELSEVRTLTTNNQQISKLGFSNLNELVEKGVATEILKVGDNDEKE